MEQIGKVIKKRRTANNVTNDNVFITNNDNNVTSKKTGKYALDRNKFIPNTEETQLAEEISTFFDDLQNFAFYWHVIKRIGIPRAMSFWKSVKEEIEDKRGTKYEIRSPKKYFAWKFRYKKY